MTMTAMRDLEAEVPTDRWYGVYPALVRNVADPESLGRVEVHLPWSADQGGPSPSQKHSVTEMWARVATLGAGAGRGTWFRPEIGDEVLVAFEGGNPARPYVVGCLWNGQDLPPSGVDNSSENRIKLIRTRSGVQIVIDDSDGTERLELRTPGGVTLKMKDGPLGASFEVETPGGQRVSLVDDSEELTIIDGGGNKVLLKSSGIVIQSLAKVVVNASTVELVGSAVKVKAATATFDGTVKCDKLVARSVDADSYTPGAGNIW